MTVKELVAYANSGKRAQTPPTTIKHLLLLPLPRRLPKED